MESRKEKGTDPEPLSESERRILRTYGKLPYRGLLGQQPKQRKYFDSGDFALAAAGKVTDNGAIRPGTVHPLRKSISRPHAPVPDRCNVNEGANENIHDKKSGSTDMTDSPLRQQTDKIEKTKRPREES